MYPKGRSGHLFAFSPFILIRRQQINLAEEALARWDLAAAEAAFRRVIEDPALSDEREVYGDFGLPDWIAYARFRLGEIYALRGEVEAARREVALAAVGGGAGRIAPVAGARALRSTSGRCADRHHAIPAAVRKDSVTTCHAH